MHHRYVVTYGHSNSFIVRDLEALKRKKNSIVYSSMSKSECISRAQELNGWVVDGNEQTYGRQVAGQTENTGT